MWTPDSELEQISLETIDALCGVLTHAPSAAREDVLALLEAVGTLAAMDGAEVGVRRVSPSVVQVVRDLLAALELPELDDASVSLLMEAPRCLTLDEELVDDELRPVLDALRTRDRAELLWLGAEALNLGSAMSDEAFAARAAFDECLAPELWQLLPLGRRRSVELEWVAPKEVARFWWRSRGAELPANALDEPAQWAKVREFFPESGEHLDALARLFPGHATRTARGEDKKDNVVSLAGFLDRRRAMHERCAAAAAGAPGAEEVPVVRVGGVEVGVVGSTLIIDVVDDLVPGSTPELVNAEVRLPGVLVADSNQRFTIALGDEDRARSGWTLVLPLASGSVEMPLDDSNAD